MALDSVLLAARSLVSVKLETTNGTRNAPDATNATFPRFNAVLTPDVQVIPREPQGSSISPIKSLAGSRAARITFDQFMQGDGSASPPQWFDLLRMCGLSLSVATLTPVTPPTETGTIYHYRSGMMQVMLGCMGNASITFTNGAPANIGFEVMGVLDADEDEAFVSPTYNTTIAPRGHSTFTIGGTTYPISSWTLETGNEIQMREHPTAADANSEYTGFKNAQIIRRRPRFTVDPEAVLIATKDWMDIWRDRTEVALVATLAGGANNTFAITAPEMYLAEPPVLDERTGKLISRLVFECCRNTDAGENEISIVAS